MNQIMTIDKNFRNPTLDEKNNLSRFVECQNKMNIKSQKRIVIGLFIIASILVIPVIMTPKDGGTIMMALLGLGCIIGAMSCIKGYKKYNNFTQNVKSGKFLICEGVVTKVASRDSNGRMSIGFASKDDTFKSEWYKVRIEDICIGKTAYLIAASSKKDKKYDVIAVTPFMLSDEGYNLFC